MRNDNPFPEEIISKLTENYEVIFLDNFKFTPELFNAFQDNRASLISCLEVKHDNKVLHLLVVNVNYMAANLMDELAGANLIQSDLQFWGYCELKKQYANIFIKNETIEDKIKSFFTSEDIDFDDDVDFSKKFHVVSDNKTLAISTLDKNFRKSLMEIDMEEVMVEIKNNYLLIGNEKPLSLNILNVDKMIKFIFNVC